MNFNTCILISLPVQNKKNPDITNLQICFYFLEGLFSEMCGVKVDKSKFFYAVSYFGVC